MKVLSELPVPFFLCCLVIVAGAIHAWQFRRQAWGLPCMAVLATVSVWYIGDAFYNDYSEYIIHLGAGTLEAAWWEVLVFLVSFIVLVPVMHGVINPLFKHRGSMMMRYFETRRLEHPEVQHRISMAATGLFIVWGLLMVFALVRVKGDFIGLFAPYLGAKVDPWGRARIGGGFDAIIALAAYVQLFLAAGAGVVAAVSRNPATRSMAVVICFLMFPGYIFDRTRNVMLAAMLPGLLAWVFLRIRGGMVVKIAVLAGSFMVVNIWFSFIMANRTDVNIAQAMADKSLRSERTGRHEGLNMFEELGWINYLTDKGTYKPNMGGRYFAELVNPVPRIIWKNKPQIGIDYAIARGQGGGSDDSAGVFATMSTGMIGQGVVNFGGIVGPMAAALLMACWVAMLARQDLLGADPARLLLYSIGMTLTFNIGRDITLLVLYPFLFGLLMLKVWYLFRKDEHLMQRSVGKTRRNKVRRKRVKVPWHVEESMASPENSHDGPVEVSERRL